MTMTGHTIIGVFDEPAMADQAIDALERAGFDTNQIHSSRHHTSSGFFVGLKNFFTGEEDDTTNTAYDFTDMGVSDDEARYYENEHQAGHAVVAVRADGREQEAMDILRTNGAYNYAMRQNAARMQNASTATSTMSTTNDSVDVPVTDANRTRLSEYPDTEEQRTLKLREEQLDVNKERVQSGEVQLHKEVVAEQKTVNVPVTHEEVYIERRPVTEGTVDDGAPIGESETIRVPASAEKVNVSKDTVVTGEVSVGKRAVEETQQVTDTVRREEARIEQQGDAQIHDTTNDRFYQNTNNEEKL